MYRRFITIVFFAGMVCALPLPAQLVSKGDSRPEIQASHPHPGKCGYAHMTVETLQRIAAGETIQTRPLMMTSAPSPSGRFLIHFDTMGVNQVDVTDENLNGIPDYIDSVAFYFDEAYRLEVDVLGYPAPATDNNEGGSDAYDVYVQELNLRVPPLYGSATPEVRIGSGGLLGRFTSYITIDNNFSPLDSTGRREDGFFAARSYFTTGVDAVKITAAHEFHHAIQFSAYGNNPDQIMFHEMTSTWLEFRLYPEIEDYMQYLPGFFADLSALPFSSNFSAPAGYAHNIFGQYIQKEFGDNTFKRMWELSVDISSFYNALDSALKEDDGALSEQWCDFLPWLYHTAERAEFGQYFDNASNFPSATFNREEVFTPPSITISGALSPLESRFFRLILPVHDQSFRLDIPLEDQNFRADTIDIALSNIDTASISLTQRISSEFTIICTRGPGRAEASRISGTEYYLEISAPNDKICSELYLRERFLNIDFAYPNPYSPTRDGMLMLPVPEQTQSDNVNVTIYNSAMEIVYSASQPTDTDGQRRVVKWPGTTLNGNRATSGVYIFVVDSDEEEVTGKFALIARQ